MGSYNFRWGHPAGEVFVTGTFDDWSKSVRLEHANGGFEKLVDLPTTGRKIYYKFVVDGHWTTDYGLACENDGSGNVNNFLTPEDIKPAQQASTHHDDMPGAFPETPAFESQSQSYLEYRPGPRRAQRSFRDDSSNSAYQDSSPEQSYGVSPLPAFAGFGNPVSLAPGQEVPHHSNYTSNSIGSNVKLDQESYERSDAYPSSGGSDAFSQSRGAFGVPPVGGNMIPESSLPMGYDGGNIERDAGPTIQSAGTGTSTASLAGQVPLEPRGVPRVVSESQEAAGVDPEASASSEAVSEKKQMEQEFMSVIPEERAVSSDYRDSTGTSETQPASSVPQVVADSQYKAHESPEAAGNPEAVSDKQQMEEELRSRVPLEPVTSQGDRDLSGAISEPASNVPQIVADSQYEADEPFEAAGNAQAVSEKSAMEEELKSRVPLEPVTSEGDRYLAGREATEPASNVPQVVADSQYEADAPVEAAGNSEAVSEKQAMEEELKSKIPEEPAASESRSVDQSTGESTAESTAESTGATIGGIQIGKYAAAASSWMPASIQQAITDMNHGKSPIPALTGSGTADEETATSTDKEVTSTTAGESTSGAYEEPTTAAEESTSAAHEELTTTADDVPSIVTDSLDQAHQSPEAAAYPEAVAEKSAFERELLRDVPPAEGTGEPAPTEASALSETAPAPTQEYSTLLDEDTAPAINAMTIGGRDTSVLVAPRSEEPTETAAAQDYSREVEDIPAAATYEDRNIGSTTDYSQTSQAEADVVPAAAYEDRNIGSTTNYTQTSQTETEVVPTATDYSQSREMAADPAGNTWAQQTTQSQYSSEAPRSVVDRVFGAPVVNDVSSSSEGVTSYQTTSAAPTSYQTAAPTSYQTTAPTSYQTAASTSYQTAAPTSYQTVAPTSYETAAPVGSSPRANLTEQGPIDPFKDDPISAFSGSIPAATSSSSNLDPRTVASAFANDPISASESTASRSVPTMPAATTMPLPTSATTPSKAQTYTPAPISTPISTPTKQTTTSPALAAASSAAAAASKRNSVLPPSSSGLNAPASAPARTPASSMAQAIKQSGSESRDVSPMSRNQGGPSVTTGVGATKAVESRTSGWQAGSAPSGSAVGGASASASGSRKATGSPSASPAKDVKEEKRRKRQSFFGKLKDKLSGHK